MRRRLPNILITGTPGTGKSTLSSEICDITSMEWINITDFAKANNCIEEYDENLATHILNADKVVDELEDKMADGGILVEYHSSDFFPEDWFDIVFVLTTDNTILYDRLVRRGYSGKKLENNIECEIFQTVLDEARGAYDASIVFRLESNTPMDMESNIEKICRWIENFNSNNHDG